jgi:hypothetical protein
MRCDAVVVNEHNNSSRQEDGFIWFPSRWRRFLYAYKGAKLPSNGFITAS